MFSAYILPSRRRHPEIKLISLAPAASCYQQVQAACRRPDVESLELYLMIAAWLPIAGVALALCMSADKDSDAEMGG